MKCGFISLVGRPSTGKSTLVNALCHQHVAITSPKPQTTRKVIRGIVQRPQAQIILLDTPGFHSEQRPLSQELWRMVRRAADASNALLYLLDGSRQWGEEERELSAWVKQAAPNPLLVVNKRDLATAKTLDRVQQQLQQLWPEVPIHQISAKKNEGLDALADAMIAHLPEGKPLYPQDVYTDQGVEFRISEIVREQAIACTSEELPYAIHVEVADLSPREDGQWWARIFLLVERDSQKGIVVGKAGKRIRDIRKQSERMLRKIFPYRIELDIRVKVQRNWRQSRATVRKMLALGDG